MKNRIIILSILMLQIVAINYTQAQRIAAGGWHSVVVTHDNTVKAFGENATGELGNGSTTDSNLPVSTGITDAIAVSAGGDQLEAHSMALKSDGTVWAWGSNLYGALGNASTTSTTTPVQSIMLSNIIAISAGGWHSVALKNDGTVWAWGWNLDGELGDGTTEDKTIPAQVPGLSGITQISAGTYHVLALKNDGTVWAWGDNISGQIGNGNKGTDVKTPVKVSNLTGVVRIAAGRFFSLAIKSDGTVWTWGENLYGQLGDGSTTDRTTPVQVTSLTGITSAVAATGAFHCMAVKNDNTVWSWGRNTYGNLGDNTVTNRFTPVQMLGISDVAGMAAGTNFSILYKTDGTFWGCGRNASGQLGDGTFLQRNVLTQSPAVSQILASVPSTPSYNDLDVTISANYSKKGMFEVQLTELSGSLSDTQIEIYDVKGKKVYTKTQNYRETHAPITVDISSQSSGVYILRIHAKGYDVSKKFIKQ